MYIIVSVLIAFFMGAYMSTLVWYDHCAQQTISACIENESKTCMFDACAQYACALYCSVCAMRHALEFGQQRYQFVYAPEGLPYRCLCVCTWHNKSAGIIQVLCTLEKSKHLTKKTIMRTLSEKKLYVKLRTIVTK